MRVAFLAPSVESPLGQLRPFKGYSKSALHSDIDLLDSTVSASRLSSRAALRRAIEFALPREASTNDDCPVGSGSGLSTFSEAWRIKWRSIARGVLGPV